MRLKIVLGIIISLFLFSCENYNGSSLSNNSNEEDQRYYVKYEAKMSSIYTGMRVVVFTDIGPLTFDCATTFSETFGPVSKGFKATISAECLAYSCKSLDVSIYICKGDEPFVLKSKGSYNTEYVIDF